jgi:3-oxoacyl-[acyl-carrier protein] reductase
MIIVSGGTHGIGRTCVELLSRQGEAVVFCGRDREAGAEVERVATGSHFVACDVASEDDCRRVVDVALNLNGGRIGGLVNNAGASSRTSFAESSTTDWDRLMNVNARSAYLLTRFALAGLIAGKGSVVNVASIAGKVGEEGLAIYTASKAALIGLTRALALEFGETVRFNAICPGQIDTRMMGRVKADANKLRRLEQRIPIGRLGTALEVAQTIAWLLSPQASYVNGAVLAVDGGETAGLRTPQ